MGFNTRTEQNNTHTHHRHTDAHTHTHTLAWFGKNPHFAAEPHPALRRHAGCSAGRLLAGKGGVVDKRDMHVRVFGPASIVERKSNSFQVVCAEHIELGFTQRDFAVEAS